MGLPFCKHMICIYLSFSPFMEILGWRNLDHFVHFNGVWYVTHFERHKNIVLLLQTRRQKF